MPLKKKEKVRILLISQNDELLLFVEKVLGIHRYIIKKASSLLEALDECITFIPQIIIMEKEKDPLSFKQFIEDFSRYPPYALAPILILADKRGPKGENHSHQALPIDYLTIPIQTQELVSKIKKLLHQSTQKDLHSISPYRAKVRVSINILNQMENIISFEAPLKMKRLKHFRLIIGQENRLYASSIEGSNILSPYNLYKNIIVFDPLEGKDFKQPLNDLNFIYHLEDILAQEKPSIHVIGEDSKSCEILKKFLTKFQTTHTFSENVLGLEKSELKKYQAIIYSFSGKDSDHLQLAHLQEESENTPIIVALSKEERKRTPPGLVKECIVIPKPFDRNNILLNLARIINLSLIQGEMMRHSPQTSFSRAQLEFPLSISSVDEIGLVMKSPLLIQKGSEFVLLLREIFNPKSSQEIKLSVHDVTYQDEEKYYKISCRFKDLNNSQIANIIYHLHTFDS